MKQTLVNEINRTEKLIREYKLIKDRSIAASGKISMLRHYIGLARDALKSDDPARINNMINNLQDAR